MYRTQGLGNGSSKNIELGNMPIECIYEMMHLRPLMSSLLIEPTMTHNVHLLSITPQTNKIQVWEETIEGKV